MTKDELQKQVLEALSSGKLNPTTIIMGDNVQNKIEKVESGGVVNISGGQMDEQSRQEQNIVPEPENEPSQKPKGLFPRITKAAYDAGKAQQVDDELRSASVSAPKLVKAINFNEAMNYLDTKNMSSNELYDLLNEYYDLPFKPRCFRYYRSK